METVTSLHLNFLKLLIFKEKDFTKSIIFDRYDESL